MPPRSLVLVLAVSTVISACRSSGGGGGGVWVASAEPVPDGVSFLAGDAAAPADTGSDIGVTGRSGQDAGVGDGGASPRSADTGDAATIDTVSIDTVSIDTGAPDAVAIDAGPADDTGSADAGPADAGPADTGLGDAGSSGQLDTSGDISPPGAKVLINEVFYDAVGSDTDVFVELRGPPGADLSGYLLLGINGKGGKAYNKVVLSGAIGPKGWFVVAKDTAAGATAAAASVAGMLDKKADYQNGPDSVQLLKDGLVLDAVGYGDFTASSFAGEGKPAPDVAAGHSLSRDSAGHDTDDNLSDFQDLATPTPGSLGTGQAP